MQPFRVHEGVVAPLDRANIDTDQIIPKQVLKRIERRGFGPFLFHDWRFDAEGRPEPGFVLNQPRFAGATLLVAGRNFGCGSSREHAPWALSDYGFRAILAPSFADIFATNCAKNGLLTVVLAESEIAAIVHRAEAEHGYRLTVDLEQLAVFDTGGFRAAFSIDPFRRSCLLDGLDEIGLTLRYAAEIEAYEAVRMPHPPPPGWPLIRSMTAGRK